MLEGMISLLTRFCGPGFVDWFGSSLLPRDARKVYKSYRKGQSVLDGPYIEKYEKTLSDYYDGMDVITFGAGRMALYAILKAMGATDRAFERYLYSRE